MFPTRLAGAALAIACLATGPARADVLQAQVLAAARANHTDDLAFRRTITIDATGQARKVFVEQYDPRRAGADRWTLLSVDGRAPSPKDLADAHKRKREPVRGYAEIADWIGAPATRSEVGPGHVLYKFPRLPAGALKINSHDASADTRAEALVNTSGQTPYVERVRLTSTKGFRMMLVASVDSLVIDGRYTVLPDGRIVSGGNQSVVAGSMLGKSGQIKTGIAYSNFEHVR